MTEPNPLDTPVETVEVFTVPNHKASRDENATDKADKRNGRSFWEPRGTDRSKPRNQRPRTYKPAPDYHKGKYVEQLETLYGGIAAMMAPFHQDCGCAHVIAAQATSCAESVDELAGEFPAVRRFLEGGGKFSAVVGVAIAHAPIAAAIATSHTPVVQRLYARMGHEQGQQPQEEYTRP